MSFDSSVQVDAAGDGVRDAKQVTITALADAAAGHATLVITDGEHVHLNVQMTADEMHALSIRLARTADIAKT